MKLLTLIGVIIAGMSGCGAARVAHQAPRAVACSHAQASLPAAPATRLAG